MTNAVSTIPNAAAALIDVLIASNRGDRQAFTYNGKRYSYQDVAALMNRAGNLVKSVGVERGEAVLVLVPPSPAWIATLLGAMKARAIPVVCLPSDAKALELCVATNRPRAAVVHEARLDGARDALQTLSPERVVVVGGNVDGYRSFVDELRTQPSWLAAEDVATHDVALGVWNGHTVSAVTHAALTEFVQQSGSSTLAGVSSDEAILLGNMLRAFHRGEELALN